MKNYHLKEQMMFFQPFGNINIHFTTFEQTYEAIVGQFLVHASLKRKVSISSESKMFCSISHSIYVYDKKVEYNSDITFKDKNLNQFKDLLNKLLNENPKNFFDRVKFAMRDGTVTLIPLSDLSFKIVFEFKRNPDRYLTNTGELEIIVSNIGSPPSLKEYVLATAKSLSNVNFALALEQTFNLQIRQMLSSGFYLLIIALIQKLLFA